MPDIQLTSEDINSLIQNDPMAALKVQNFALVRTLLESEKRIVELELELSRNGTGKLEEAKL
jgi:hypothetical protein